MMPDLDTPERIDAFIDAFYERVLNDPLLAPVFLDVAAIDVPEHLTVIKAYWRKMLLGHDSYSHNMMARHEAIHGRCYLEGRHFDRWLALYRDTLAARFQGPCARRADTLAVTIASNMQRWLHSDKGEASARQHAQAAMR